VRVSHLRHACDMTGSFRVSSFRDSTNIRRTVTSMNPFSLRYVISSSPSLCPLSET
jgi:hypothetical protein